MKKLFAFVLLSALAANAGVVRFAAKSSAKGAKHAAHAAKKAGKLAFKAAY